MNINRIILTAVGLCAAATMIGCTSSRVKNVELDGLFVQGDTGTMAIGSIDVMASPKGEESAVIKYDQDTPWINPTGKAMNHIKIMLTGTNSTDKADAIVEHICKAFVPTAAILSGEPVSTNAFPIVKPSSN